MYVSKSVLRALCAFALKFFPLKGRPHQSITVQPNPAARSTRAEAHDRRWAAVFALLVLAGTTLPYAWGFANQGSDWVFTGFVFGVEDGNSYLAKMLGGTAGAWLFRTPYTAASQSGIVAFLPYLLLGKLAAPPGLHEQLAALFHLFRIGAGFLAVLATFDFICFFIVDRRLRRFGLALAVLGGGLGWVLVLSGKSVWLGSLPLEFYSPETFGFLALYGVPHLALGRAALLWGLLNYLKGIQTAASFSQGGALRRALITGALWLLAALAQPLVGVLFGVVIALHLTALAVCEIRRTRTLFGCFRLAVLSAILPAPFLLYNALAFGLDPFLRAWTAQNLIPSPHPLHYLLAYGLLLPYAVPGVKRLLAGRPLDGPLLGAWVLALPVLVYLPFNLQRRLSEGVWVALVILALKGLEARQPAPLPRQQLRSFMHKTLRVPSVPSIPSVPSVPLFLTFPSTLLLLGGGILAASSRAVPVFRPAAEVAAFQALAQEAAAGDIVLASYETGNALPAWAPLRVVIGHGPESAGLSGLRPRVAAFYSTASDVERLALLREFDVRYVFHGPTERTLGAWDPGGSSYLQPIYNRDGYAVYEVLLLDREVEEPNPPAPFPGGKNRRLREGGVEYKGLSYLTPECKEIGEKLFTPASQPGKRLVGKPLTLPSLKVSWQFRNPLAPPSLKRRFLPPGKGAGGLGLPPTPLSPIP